MDQNWKVEPTVSIVKPAGVKCHYDQVVACCVF